MDNIIQFLVVLTGAVQLYCQGSALECDCAQKHFACDGTSCTCIPIEWKCDGDNDCGDQSDEVGCAKEPCASDYFRCANSMCISNRWVCDGANDCGDESDESTCGGDHPDKSCGQGNHLCNDMKCISNDWRCDGDFDCSDGSDEQLCDTRNSEVIAINVTCEIEEFACEQFGECVLDDYRCDGDEDCSDGSDEKHCYNQCKAEEFQCRNRQCIPQSNRCDESEDCGDGSDEVECIGKENESCMENEFQCDNGICISDTWRCDKDRDCEDNSDEKNCGISSCDSDQFKCEKSFQCIRKTWKCDGEFDCVDNSDEKDCDDVLGKCSDDQFSCESGQCIGLHKFCNGHPDCFDYSDEPPELNCNSTGTTQICHNTVAGVTCKCKEGFEVGLDRASCVDINECKVESTCSQKCVNTNGSFLCSCSGGYSLRHDGRTCKAKGPPVSLFFANRIDIKKFQIENSELKSVIEGLENAVAIDYHLTNQLIYWSDVSSNSIKSSYLNDSSKAKEIAVGALQSPSGVAVDWIHDLLYWTDSGTSKIEVSNLHGQYRKVIVWEKLEKPRAISLHPQKCLLFWTDWGVSPRLESAWMDGRGRKILVSKNLHWPNGLTLDYTRDHVYWADAKHHIIERIDIDGKNRKPIITRALPHPFSITVFEDKLYWTDWDTKSINTANKFTGSGLRSLHSHLHFPMGIQVYHPLRQPKGESQCAQNECSQLCLPYPYGHSCACETGYRLINETHCASTIDEFLVFARKTEIRRISFDADNHSDSVLSLKKLQGAMALDWDSEGYVYWSDVETDTISRAEWDGSHQKVIISTNLDSPAGLAVDWMNRKLYWTDAGHNRIEVSLLDGSVRCVLVWTNLYRPRDIVLYPTKGLMFWSDWGDKPKIERSSMDGNNRIAVVTQGLKSPNGLALDFADNRLYWTDIRSDSIESCNLDGSGRKVILSINIPHAFGLALHKNRIYWTDWSLNMIQSADKKTGRNRKVIRENIEYLMDIHYYETNRETTFNPCSERNGNCSHLCLLTPSATDTLSFTCACPTGLALSADDRTCNSHMNKFIAIARRSDIRVISLDVPYSADVKLSFIENIINVVEIAIDPTQGYLYWSDIGSRCIARKKLMTEHEKSEIIMDTGLGTVDGLAIDVLEQKLYWTDADRELVMVSELDGSSQKVLVHEDLDSPRAIVLHHKSGYLYWSDWGSSPKIERIGMDGTNRSIIITKNLIWPNGLTIDDEEDILIWGDAHIEVIECSDLLGRHRRVLKVGTPHPYSLTTLDGYLYWTDWQSRNVERLNLRNTSDFSIIRKNLPNIMGIKAVDLNQKDNTFDRKICDGTEGCSHLCLRSPTSRQGYRCACPTGVKLRKDLKICDSMPEQFLLFTSRNEIRRLSLDTDTNVFVQLPIAGLENVIAIDYHYKSKTLYFTDVYLDVIKSAKLDGSNLKTLVEGGPGTMDGIAVDWIANNLYWTDTGPNTLSVARLDGRKRKMLISTGLDEPRAIALHPMKGKMFWTDWGSKPRIESAYLDGSSRKVLISERIVWPNGLTVDVVSGKIFWVDAHSSVRKIETCDLNGRNRTVVVSKVLHGFSLAFMANQLYWTDWKTHAIETSDLQPGSPHRAKLLDGIEGLMDIKAASMHQQQGTNVCDASKGYGGCDDLCLMQGSAKYICVEADKKDISGLSTRLTKPTARPKQGGFSTKKFDVSTIKPGAPNPGESNSYFVGILAILLAVFAVLTIIGLIIWRCLLVKKPQEREQNGRIDVTVQLNQGYTTGSQNTLSTRVEMRTSTGPIAMKMTRIKTSSSTNSPKSSQYDETQIELLADEPDSQINDAEKNIYIPAIEHANDIESNTELEPTENSGDSIADLAV